MGDRSAICKECRAIGTGTPLLKHGNLKMCQSTAIQTYLALIAPRFSSLPADARAIDAMWFAYVEDYLPALDKTGFFKQLFGGGACDKKTLLETVEKFMGHFESRVPNTGYINGKPFPTGADCVVLMLCKSKAPFGYVLSMSGVNLSKYPKTVALAERTAEAQGIKEYIAKSTSFNNPGPFGGK